MDKTAIGRNINKKMLAHGMTMRGLADSIGVTSATVCRWINGTRDPKAYAVYRMARVFGCTMEELMEGVEG